MIATGPATIADRPPCIATIRKRGTPTHGAQEVLMDDGAGTGKWEGSLTMPPEMLKWAVEVGKVHRRVLIRYFARWSIWCLAPEQVGSASLPC
jgi:hypothetical protein